jgi:CheY-like chemotaxis protein
MVMQRVLVVDDEREIREVMVEVLRDEGYEVFSAADGLEGLERLREALPNLVLLDLMMPGMNGWQFRAKQLEQPELARIPVIVVSALGTDGSLGVQGAIEKPFDLSLLLSEVKRLALAV